LSNCNVVALENAVHPIQESRTARLMRGLIFDELPSL